MYPALIWSTFLLIVILLFKRQLILIFEAVIGIGNKTKNIQYKGLNIDLGSNTDSIAITQQATTDVKQAIYQKAYQNIIITNEEQIIRNQLVEAKFSKDQAIDILIYHLANRNFLVKLLEIHRLIFPQQIRLLFFLNEQVEPRTSSDLLPFYQEWVKISGGTEYPLQQFLNFLIQSGLMLEDLNGYQISNLGKEYLAYLIRIGWNVPRG
ncbi:hypothetical protein SC828_05040 [Legionella pneumophila serogroup 1]